MERLRNAFIKKPSQIEVSNVSEALHALRKGVAQEIILREEHAGDESVNSTLRDNNVPLNVDITKEPAQTPAFNEFPGGTSDDFYEGSNIFTIPPNAESKEADQIIAEFLGSPLPNDTDKVEEPTPKTKIARKATLFRRFLPKIAPPFKTVTSGD